MVLNAGANVVFTTKGIDDMALKYFVEAGAIACRRVKKEDLRRIAKCTGASVVLTFGDMEGNESFDSSLLGSAEEVSEERVADDDMILIKARPDGLSQPQPLRRRTPARLNANTAQRACREGVQNSIPCRLGTAF